MVCIYSYRTTEIYEKDYIDYLLIFTTSEGYLQYVCGVKIRLTDLFFANALLNFVKLYLGYER